MEDTHIIRTPDGEVFDIPVGGSLGLLALGDLGLMAWRHKIEQVKREMGKRSASATIGSGQSVDTALNGDSKKTE